MDLDSEVGLTEGNIFQGELTMDQLMFNRPVPGYAQYRTPLKNMYICSSSTHPRTNHESGERWNDILPSTYF